MEKICVIIGARPQFIKHAPMELALRHFFNVFTIHTGQHYDQKMSDIFFEQLKIEKPKYLLKVGSATHGRQTGTMLSKIEEILLSECPSYVLVYGDTNSTLSGALAASKLRIPVIHIEAGLRSYNKDMPEEINRVLTDHISEFLFVPTPQAIENLKKEGITKGVFNAGDVMFDALMLAKEVIGNKYKNENHVLVTIHRPYNTDNIDRLVSIIKNLNSLKFKIVFPIHPRTHRILVKNNIDLSNFQNINFIEPVSYFELIKLQLESKCIITDSGGVQKEAYMLKKQCITLRSETEWIETLEGGWNSLVFDDLSLIEFYLKKEPKSYHENLYGDGKASQKITEILYNSIKHSKLFSP